MVLPIMVACGDDDDNVGNGISYTESEIVEILTGKWGINGFVRISTDGGEKIEGDYTGTVEFTNDQKYIFKCSVIEGTQISLSSLIEGNNYQKYSVLRKNGNSYITFGSSSNYKSFQIVSINKNSFKLIEDEDMPSSLHYYITIISE